MHFVEKNYRSETVNFLVRRFCCSKVMFMYVNVESISKVEFVIISSERAKTIHFDHHLEGCIILFKFPEMRF